MKTKTFKMDVNEQFLTTIENLTKEAGFDGKEQLFSSSLALFEWCINRVKEGKKIVAIDSFDEETSLKMKPFEYVFEKTFPEISKLYQSKMNMSDFPKRMFQFEESLKNNFTKRNFPEDLIFVEFREKVSKVFNDNPYLAPNELNPLIEKLMDNLEVKEG